MKAIERCVVRWDGPGDTDLLHDFLVSINDEMAVATISDITAAFAEWLDRLRQLEEGVKLVQECGGD